MLGKVMNVLKINDLLDAAKQRTGLSDFGPDDFMEGLAALVEGINKDVRIIPDRWEIVKEWLVHLLMNRLWFASDLIQHPEILDEELGSPVVISSLPRTASTKLHRMLGASGDFQVTRFWHVHMFARIPGLEDGGKARRIQETREFEKWMYEASPRMIYGHPLFTDEPEEDMYLGEFTFRHPMVQGRFCSDIYVEWLSTADLTPMYQYLRMQLKYLQWQDKTQAGKPWLLKTPMHFGSEKWLVDLFGGGRFIVTHRNPVKCIPSITSTTLATRELFLEGSTFENTGPEMTSLFSSLANEHMRWRDENPDIPVLDLGFDEITHDGMSAIRKVYDFLDMPLSAEAEKAMLAWEKNNVKGKHGEHKYSAEELGTTEEAIRQEFRVYSERFSGYL